ncbi:hypothetical protein [Streptomyces odontomachi]|uniref:hypothetical protein n=1 Tax=Streptomyces odontomachi TaxID=2944940 RepID=UPI00210CEA2B|nr:hypothetical protein [Streptomyces sp. ODS25]
MTAILPEQPAVLADVLRDLADEPPETRAAIGAGLIRALRLPRHQAPDGATDADDIASVEAGLTEGYEAYCARISKETK